MRAAPTSWPTFTATTKRANTTSSSIFSFLCCRAVPMATKQRLDLLLVERELVETRTRAQARIMAGDVFVNGQRVDKAGTRIPLDAPIELKGDELPYVSRGGL